MNTQQEETLLLFFKAVGQPDRARILGLLANRAYTVPELAKLLDMKETAVQNHVNKLKKSGLIREDAKKSRLQFDSDVLERFNDIVFEPAESDPFFAWILEEYIDGSRLKSVPENEAERLVILKWLSRDFETDRDYTQAEVNQIIQGFFHDASTLRKYLIDSGLLIQDGDIFRRPAPEEV